MFHLQTAALVAAGIHIPLALTVWSMLVRRANGWTLRLWVSGSLAMGTAATLLVAQDSLPRWMGHELAGALFSASAALRIAALRRDLGWPMRASVLLGLCVLDYGGYLYTLYRRDEAEQVALGYASLAAWSLAFCWHAVQAGRHLASRSGLVLGGAEGLFAATLLLRLAVIALGGSDAHAIGDEWDFALLVTAGLLAALYGNLGYLGLVLDRTNAAARQAREAERAEALRRAAAEDVADELRTLLAERDRLAAERERTLHLLAYEIRQPLHNAGGVLQAAITALTARGPAPQPMPAGSGTEPARHGDAPVDQWLVRAQGVIGGVQSTLDNTLAWASLLRCESLPVLLDTELELLVQLALGDLPPDQRGRVGLHWRTSHRSIEVEPGLIRLALRNLLRNAYAHGGPGVHVSLEVSDCAQPPALLVTVKDDGPGMLLPMAGTACSTSAVVRHDAAPGEGLGLFVARRVAALHAGELRLAPGAERGLEATLVLPLRAEG